MNCYLVELVRSLTAPPPPPPPVKKGWPWWAWALIGAGAIYVLGDNKK